VQLRVALRIDVAGHGETFDAALAQDLDLDEFIDWVEAGLEEARFVLRRSGEAGAVVMTPLARAIARPFSTVVVPGADGGGCRYRRRDLPERRSWSDSLPSRVLRQRREALTCALAAGAELGTDPAPCRWR
jgi:ATP-dependent helicase/nuclease subunit B